MINKKYTIYLAGGTKDLSAQSLDTWCSEVSAKLSEYDSDCQIVNPSDYFDFTKLSVDDSEREKREYALYQVRHSDLLIVYFHSQNPVGTAQELAIAAEYKIPVIGLNQGSCPLHPWLSECCNKIFTDVDRLVEYVYEYYLI